MFARLVVAVALSVCLGGVQVVKLVTRARQFIIHDFIGILLEHASIVVPIPFSTISNDCAFSSH